MIPHAGRIITKALIVIPVVAFLTCCAGAQSDTETPALSSSQLHALELPAAVGSQLQSAIDRGDYVDAEKLLLPEIQHSSKSEHQARLLNFIGGVYFLDHDYLNAAVAWNKSNSIAPLPEPLEFSLSMTYIRLARPSWARRVLERLARLDPVDALYPYWLGRMAYDTKSYDTAIRYFQRSIALDPVMARAHDNLGLCYFYSNKTALAVAEYNKAIELYRASPRPSAWPYINLASALEFTGDFNEAELNLRKAIKIDPAIAAPHFELGNILVDNGHSAQAIEEFREAVRLKADYAEPHIALARLYRKLGDKAKARREVQAYLRIRDHSSAKSDTAYGSPR